MWKFCQNKTLGETLYSTSKSSMPKTRLDPLEIVWGISFPFSNV
ncbi:hypothetical protein HMPREF3226_00045 [Prevotella corporis]|uniref:Uncharacterized protein n=1 Tax=Prevotella corporis TaxID=28128 RepID=A0A133QQB9_9BACT|nr:hypothetical protein HMPREF3226_00045 [Prevotella corporis]